MKGCRRKTLIIDRGSTITSPFKTDTLDYESSRKIKVESIRRTEYGTHEFKYRNCWQEDPSDPRSGRPEPSQVCRSAGRPPTTLKNYELGYREVGGAFLVALAHHPDLHKFTLWLLADKKVAEIGQIGPDDIAKA